ncbi:MAG: hypothetical protein KF785_11290 [Gemmatimonadales bacterium]|nr:hypothetical protein [Gemmatimonadales bacterium]
MIDYIAFSMYCATCHHWTGQRRPEMMGGRIYTPRHATVGSCDCPTGHWRGRLKPGESNCPHWAQWNVMREFTGPPPVRPPAT